MTDFFAAGSPYLAHPLLTGERSTREAEQLRDALFSHPVVAHGAGSTPTPGTILDVGCGFGRHTVALAALGHPTVGIDPSATMIEAAEAAARKAAASNVTFRCLAGEDLTDVDQFDGAICMFTSLGQMTPADPDVDNRSMLENVAQAVRPGGRLVVEVPVRERAVAALVSDEVFGSGEDRTEVSRRFDEPTNRMVEQFRVFDNGVKATFDLAYTLFAPDELAELLNTFGFQPLAVRTSLDELSVDHLAPRAGEVIDVAPESPFMVALAAAR